MAFDGSIRDSFAQGRRLRPVTHDEAIQLLPLLVYRLKQGILNSTIQESPDMPKVIFLRTISKPEESWSLLLSDFLLVKRVSDQISISQFPTEPTSSVLNRITAYISVTFI